MNLLTYLSSYRALILDTCKDDCLYTHEKYIECTKYCYSVSHRDWLKENYGLIIRKNNERFGSVILKNI